MKDLSQDILNKIKKDHIKPLSKLHFVLRKSFIWTMFGLSVLIGGLAVSGIIFHVNEVDWDVYDKFRDNTPSFLMMVIPYFWLIVMAVFLFAAIYNMKHTSGGYKYGTFIILGISLLASLIIGVILFYSDINEPMEENLMPNVPLYPLLMPRGGMWNDTERGLLTGTIVDFNGPNEFHLQGAMNDPWSVNYEKARWLNKLEPRIGLRIKILGVKDGPNHFTASEIRPWFKNQKQQIKVLLRVTTTQQPLGDDYGTQPRPGNL